MSDWAFPQTIELADGTKCVRLEDFLKNDGYKELYEVAKGRIEQLQSERDEARTALRVIARMDTSRGNTRALLSVAVAKDALGLETPKH